MCEQQAALDRLGAIVVAVTFEPPSTVARFARDVALPYPVLSDPTRRAYAAFGLRRGRLTEVWNWNTLKVYLRSLLHGRRPPLPHGDLAQLGGDVVIDPDGLIVFLYRSKEPADRPKIDDLLAAIRRAAE